MDVNELVQMARSGKSPLVIEDVVDEGGREGGDEAGAVEPGDTADGEVFDARPYDAAGVFSGRLVGRVRQCIWGFPVLAVHRCPSALQRQLFAPSPCRAIGCCHVVGSVIV